VTPFWRILLIVVVALIASLFAARSLFFRVTPPDVTHAPHVPLAMVREGSVKQSIALVGRVGSPAGSQTKLAFAVPGSVERVDVGLGEHVQSGAALAQLNTTSYVLAAQQAQAEAHAATAGSVNAGIDRTSVKLRVDEAELERQQRLFSAGVVALRGVQAAQGTVAADRAEMQSSHAQLTQAQAQSRAAALHAASTSYDVDRTTLRAPAAGVVVGIFVQPGEMVDTATAAIAIAPERQGGGGTLDIPVADLGRVRVGNPVELRVNGARWPGRVAGIAPSVDPNTGLATLSISGVPSATAAGTPIDATVVVGHALGLVVPRNAVIDDPQTGQHLVFVAQRRPDGSLQFAARTVTIDVQDDAFTRIHSGLHAGERVAAEGAIDLLTPSGY
jgi:RND family efflux transporter MFP subunit